MRKKEILKDITVKRSGHRYEIWRNGLLWAYALNLKLAEDIAEDLRKTEKCEVR